MTFGGADKRPLGLVHMLVLQMIDSGKATTLAEIRASLKHRQSGENIPSMLAMLSRRDFVNEVGGNRYTLTKKGYACLPKVQAPLEVTRYVPPSYLPARPGAMDYASKPSIAADTARPYWAEGLIR